MAKTQKQELIVDFQRIRNVKPEVFRHEGLYDMEIKNRVPVRFGWVGLWTCCDKNGRFVWKPRQLKLKILPYDEIDFSKVLEALMEIDSIRKYEVDGKQYGYIPSWRKHQYVSPKELKVKSQCPAPPGVVDMPEFDDTLPENEPDSVEEPNRVGAGTAPEPGQAIKNGNGKEWETTGNGNVGSKAAQSQPHSSVEHSFDKLHSQSHSETPSPLSSQETSHSSVPLPSNGRPKWIKPGVLSRLLWESLDEETQKEAAVQWERLWTKDFEQLLYQRKLPSREVADTLLFALNSRFKKYVTHAKPFIQMYDDIREEFEKKARKPEALAKIMPHLSATTWTRLVDAAELQEELARENVGEDEDETPQ